MDWLGPRVLTEGRWSWFIDAGTGQRVLVRLDSVDYAEPTQHGAALHFASGRTVQVRQSMDDVDRALHAQPFMDEEPP
jgi:hypothetical protein